MDIRHCDSWHSCRPSAQHAGRRRNADTLRCAPIVLHVFFQTIKCENFVVLKFCVDIIINWVADSVNALIIFLLMSTITDTVVSELIYLNLYTRIIEISLPLVSNFYVDCSCISSWRSIMSIKNYSCTWYCFHITLSLLFTTSKQQNGTSSGTNLVHNVYQNVPFCAFLLLFCKVILRYPNSR